MIEIHQLIVQAQSPSNTTRESAESELLNACDSNASQIFNAIIEIANNNSEILSSRQFCLLSLRKLITMYWSPGFGSYRSTSGVEENVKEFVRASLLKLCLNNLQDSKIRSSASYCVVQISATDFPDQWPQLLSIIYESILKEHSLDAMALLNELYDDVISEEMCFEGGIGVETIKIIFEVLSADESSIETKIAVSKLFHSCIMQMSVLDNSMSAKRKEFVTECINNAFQIWVELLPKLNTVHSQEVFNLKSSIYEDLAIIKTDFPKKLFPKNIIEAFKKLSISDLQLGANFYTSIVQNDIDNLLLQSMTEYIVHVVEFLTKISNLSFEEDELIIIGQSLGALCCLNKSTEDEWDSDFNNFVSKETGLLASYTIRDQTAELLSLLDDPNFSILYSLILQELHTYVESNDNWRLQESLLYLLQCAISNDIEISQELLQHSESILQTLGIIINSSNVNNFVLSRCILVAPKFLEKVMDSLHFVKVLTKQLIFTTLENTMNNSDQLIKASALISYTYYAEFAELVSVLGISDSVAVQEKILKMIKELYDDATEDTNGMFIEVMNHLIDNNSKEQADESIREAEFHLLLSISSKDPSNIQLVVESQECLEKLLDGMNLPLYLHYCQKALPSLLKVVSEHSQTDYKYSPLLSLTLEFITVFMKKTPVDNNLPTGVSESVFLQLKEALLVSREDETLQLATEAFCFLIYNSDTATLVNCLQDIVSVLSRLLSMDISDTAAMNVGSLVVAIFTKFSEQVQELIPSILSATTSKFVNAKNISTTQNLMSVFCFLTCSEPSQTVEFLYNLESVNHQDNNLSLVLAKWLEAFEVVRGEKRIKENIMALSKLFFLSDSHIANFLVNGDIIPYTGDLIITRSMANAMPDKYTQISVYQKIVKLFLTELSSQTKKYDPNSLINSSLKNEIPDMNTYEVNDEADWEDVDGVLEYEKLQGYVDDDDDDDELNEFSDNDYQDITAAGELKQSVPELLIEFFKEAASKNINSFQNIYNSLSDEEKRILSENLL